MDNPIRVLIVDDHKIIRDGIKSLLEDAQNIEIVGEASNGLEAIEFFKKQPTDVVIMDIRMPEMGGIETTKFLTENYPNVKILALTMHDEEAFISKMLHAGASGYLLKNVGKEEFITAINKIYKGENYFSLEVATKMMTKFMSSKFNNNQDDDLQDSDLQLTKREIEVIKLIAEGLTSQDIADKLFISPRTVDTHRRNLLQKLNVKNTAELIKFAIKHNIV
ncbi:MAG: DNA-binding response regulator [Bacteroidia bacterium]|nr:MAG: DNA-binding response regulator [Bacteroidia bacterium]